MRIRNLYLQLLGVVLLLSCDNAKVQADNNHELKSDKSYKDSIAMINEIEEEAKPAYIEAYKKVTELKTYVEMAEDGQLGKNEVVAEFNRRLGPEMGMLKTLSQVKQRLDTAGEAYIQYKFTKAKADIALLKAAEKRFEINSLDSTEK